MGIIQKIKHLFSPVKEQRESLPKSTGVFRDDSSASDSFSGPSFDGRSDDRLEAERRKSEVGMAEPGSDEYLRNAEYVLRAYKNPNQETRDKLAAIQAERRRRREQEEDSEWPD